MPVWSNRVDVTHMWLLSSLNVASEAFRFNFNLEYFNSHLWLGTTRVDSTDLPIINQAGIYVKCQGTGIIENGPHHSAQPVSSLQGQGPPLDRLQSFLASVRALAKCWARGRRTDPVRSAWAASRRPRILNQDTLEHLKLLSRKKAAE